MKLRQIIIALTLALIPALLHGAGTAPSAAEVLRRAADALRKAPSVEAVFTASSGNSTTSGKILLSGNRFVLTTPMLTTWFDGKTQWAYSPDAGEVNISEPTPDELSQINPFAIVAGMQSGYTPRRLKSQPGTSCIELLPKTKSEYRNFIITFNDSNHLPKEIVITAADNSVTKINVTNIKTGGKQQQSTFRFNATMHPGVDIVDLR